MAKGRKTGGRQKGSPNKTTTVFKQAILTVYNAIGGDPSFAQWAQQNPTPFYQLAGRLIPHEVSHSGEIRMPRVVDELHRD